MDNNITSTDASFNPVIGEYITRIQREHQVKVLEDDINNVVWEKAHLALFITEEKPGTRWHNFLLRANAAFQRGDDDRFRLILEEMRETVERKKNGKANE